MADDGTEVGRSEETAAVQARAPSRAASKKILVLKGGSSKGFAYVGALRALFTEDDAFNPNRLAGASAGTISVFLLAVARVEAARAAKDEAPTKASDTRNQWGAAIKTALTEFNGLDASSKIFGLVSSRALRCIWPVPLLQLLARGHLSSGQAFKDWLEAQLSAAGLGNETTWQDLADRSNLTLCAAIAGPAGLHLVVARPAPANPTEPALPAPAAISEKQPSEGSGEPAASSGMNAADSVPNPKDEKAKDEKQQDDAKAKDENTPPAPSWSAVDIVMASSALPFAFPAVRGHIDGGVLANLPVTQVKAEFPGEGVLALHIEQDPEKEAKATPTGKALSLLGGLSAVVIIFVVLPMLTMKLEPWLASQTSWPSLLIAAGFFIGIVLTPLISAYLIATSVARMAPFARTLASMMGTLFAQNEAAALDALEEEGGLIRIKAPSVPTMDLGPSDEVRGALITAGENAAREWLGFARAGNSKPPTGHGLVYTLLFQLGGVGMIFFGLVVGGGAVWTIARFHDPSGNLGDNDLAGALNLCSGHDVGDGGSFDQECTAMLCPSGSTCPDGGFVPGLDYAVAKVDSWLAPPDSFDGGGEGCSDAGGTPIDVGREVACLLDGGALQRYGATSGLRRHKGDPTFAQCTRRSQNIFSRVALENICAAGRPYCTWNGDECTCRKVIPRTLVSACMMAYSLTPVGITTERGR